MAAFSGMLATNIVYWIAIHPVNKHWMKDQPVSASAATFFGTAREQNKAGDWMALRDRWEHAHVVRAVLASSSLLALVIALTGD
jgi:hypothetical protein